MNSLPVWLRDGATIVTCVKKSKVMKENFHEIKPMAQDALKYGLLLEVSEAQMRETLHQLIEELVNPCSTVTIKVKKALEKIHLYSARNPI
ncbi:MAG: hypothetical protein ACT4OH_01255 [Methylophilaceae bacterium]